MLKPPQQGPTDIGLRLPADTIIPEVGVTEGIVPADHREPLPVGRNPTDNRPSLLAQRTLNRPLGRLQGLCPFKDVKRRGGMASQQR